MKVDLYHVDQKTGLKTVECLGVELSTCFPDDPADAGEVAAKLDAEGAAYYGSGAAPLFYFEITPPRDPEDEAMMAAVVARKGETAA